MIKVKERYNYLISKRIFKEYDNIIDIGDYKFHYNNNGYAVYSNKNKVEIIVFGRVINSHDSTQTTKDITDDLLKANNLVELIIKSKKLAGRFVIIYNSYEGFFVIPDATSSIGVAYTICNNELLISSNPKNIADILGWEESYKSKEIKSSALETYVLPYDLTMYDNIKFVIPNHYLNCKTGKVIRYYPLEKTEKITIDEAAEITRERLITIILGYYKNYKLSLPLTAGIDSRTILSACKDIVKNIPIYTFYHENFSEETADIAIPREITSKYDLDYYVLKDLQLPSEIDLLFTKRLGSSKNSFIARNAWTYYNSVISNYTFLNGDIIPIAKSSFGRNLPEIMATTGYLTTKTHNYSKQNKKEIKRWVQAVGKYTKVSNISKYDLFFWEHRIGKWTMNSLMNYDILVDSINPFNCRELIETWLSVPRKSRTKYSIHKKIILHNWPELLDFPINPDKRYQLVYKSSLLFYCASRAKYILEKNKHK